MNDEAQELETEEEAESEGHVHGPDCSHGHIHRPEGSTFKRGGAKVKRNDPCPCGSGKKFKKCCGK